ncbi:LTA synthase family protein [Cohnella sp. REN36]|uniref:LTA synthase family protein n=1 Tax=Cohnella sp. REN36 TaxID=2887347 RepID=UPI001D15C8D1|nr:LTA synthase family protein [Cohnella sp. REN36]MCC3374689.1 LTA synthase family protein [Cohnella sp. REN36]
MTTRERAWRWLSKPFVFFTIVMIFKMYLAGYVIFEGWRAWLPLATGLPSVWVVFSLIELLAPRRKLGMYLTMNAVMTSVYFAVIMYYKYFGVIVTYHALKQVNQVTEVKGSVFSLLHPYFLLIYTDFVVLLVLLIASRKFRAWGRALKVRSSRSLFTALGTLSLAACILTIWPYRDSMNEILQAERMGILNYEAYAAFASSKDNPVDPKTVTQDAIDRLKGVREPEATPVGWGVAAGKNVIILQMEAFQNFLIGMKLDGQEITPNINKLAAESLYFDHFYQQVGQGNTADAEFVVNTSYYVPMNGAASQEYGNKELPSMPKVFAANGYQTATFHTNDVVFWNRNEMYKSLGWDTYYDKKFFGDEDTVMFAASDEVLYDKTADKLAEMQNAGSPFYVQVISMSGHHPFNLPERKYKMDLPERYEDTLVGNYIRAQNYADFALGQFIEKLKANGVWDNSVIVLYGDHQGLPIYSLTSREKDLMQEIFGREYGLPDMLNIPLLVHVPGNAMEPKVMDGVGAQSDVFPTVANLAGISLADHLHFGQDLLNQTDNLLPQRYYLPTGSFQNDTQMFVPGKDFTDGTSRALPGFAEDPKSATRQQFDNALELLSMSDSYVRSLPDRP